MSWEIVQFGAGAGRARSDEVRIGVTRQGGKMAIVVVVPGALTVEIGWQAKIGIGLNLGTGDHHGWVRLVPNAPTYTRAIRAMNSTKNLRYVTPMWPWLEGTIRETRPLEKVEHRIGPGPKQGAPMCIDLVLPAWARARAGSKDQPAMESPPQAPRGTALPIAMRPDARRHASSLTLGTGSPQPRM